MPTLVSTGQFTIVDNNDAKQLFVTLTSDKGLQQIFKKGDTSSFSPDFFNSEVTITASVYRSDVGGATEICGTLTSRKFTLGVNGGNIANSTLSDSFGDAVSATLSPNTPFTVAHPAGVKSTLKIKGNLLSTTGTFVVGFEGDYIDPITKLVSHVAQNITFSTVVAGTDANYVLFRGTTTIEGGVGSAKNAVAISADFYRGGTGLDITNLKYKWYETVSGVLAQITTSTANYQGKYGLKSITNPTLPDGTGVSVNVPPSTAAVNYNTLVISEAAVLNANTYKVEVFDTNNGTDPIAVGYQTINDVSDPYRVSILGVDKLQNSQGLASLTPSVTYGGKIMDSTGGLGIGDWKFIWYFTNKDNKRGAFIDQTRTAYNGGRIISANTNSSFTYIGTTIAGIFADHIIKIVNSAGVESYYEVASVVGQTVTIRTPPTANTFLNMTSFPPPTASDPLITNGGKFFVCTVPTPTTAVTGTITANSTTTTITGFTAGQLTAFCANQILTKVSGVGAFGGVTKIVSVDTTNLLLNILSTTNCTASTISFTAASPMGTYSTVGSDSISVSGDDIDGKGTITIEANKP